MKINGPVLLACNHPNSFLDGVILDVLFEKPLYSLARGDVFKKPIYIKLLQSLNLLPVYRISEGAVHLPINYNTFNNCKAIFQQNGIVIIFSEGKCINEWHLRPLKKGTARLAISCWKENIRLRVLPVGINYSSFRRFGKNMFINFGEIIEKKAVDLSQPDGILYQSFNTLLEQQLKQLVFEIDKKDKEKQQKILERKPSAIKKTFLFIPALVGFLTHWPVYIPIKKFTLRRTNHNDHYDSVLTGILLFIYPVYLFLLTLILFFIFHSWYVFLLLLLLPLTAWSYVQLKFQLDK
ncbi:MAG TPA: 1-acyl-sn-glycerol-3-phosphate acyltransferase [Chitinophagaceae bacterium]|nr:1-acyl-sn-glycerol-3-phosphate acyltransferase [Chitinophagaceae bacterium]